MRAMRGALVGIGLLPLLLFARPCSASNELPQDQLEASQPLPHHLAASPRAAASPRPSTRCISHECFVRQAAARNAPAIKCKDAANVRVTAGTSRSIFLRHPRCWAEFMRMPKTGSTAVYNAIVEQPTLRAAVCAHHDHLTASVAWQKLQKGAGVPPPSRSRLLLVTLRQPLERFVSLFRYSYSRFGQPGRVADFELGKTYRTLDAFVAALSAGDGRAVQLCASRNLKLTSFF